MTQSGRDAKPTSQGSPPQESGRGGEATAAEFLTARGFRIRQLNWRCRSGELDIIADEGETLVFVEVKLRSSTSHGRPIQAVDHRKQSRILRAAALYATNLGLTERSIRFDVVEVYRRADGTQCCQLIRSAFVPHGYSPL